MFRGLSPRLVVVTLAAVVMAACSPLTPIRNTDVPQPTPIQATAEPTGVLGEPRPAQIDQVAVEIGVGSPIPVYAIISGVLPSPCDQLAQVQLAQHGAEFHFSVLSTTSAEAACQPDALPFVLRVPLNVVNLPAGEYVVDANGARATFTLETGTRAASVTSIATPEAGAAPSLREAQIDHVNIVMGVGSPRPVHVIISGSLPDSCAQLGEIQLRRVGTTGAGFHIGVMTHSEAGAGCVADSLPFRLEFPLNIVNLPEGPYNVSVNGVTVSFDPRTTPAPSGHTAQIESVEVQVRASLPLDMVAIVRGLLPDAGCTTIASVTQAREGNTIRLTLTTTTDPVALCALALTPFEHTVPLDVDGLPAGTYTVVAGEASAEFELPAPDTAEFERRLREALAQRDPNAIQALMGEPFLMAYWRSEGVSIPASEAARQILTDYLYGDGAPMFQPVPAWLGFDPATMLGPEVDLAQAVFSTSWGPDGQGEALLVIARRPDGSLFWHSMLIALEGF